MPISGMVTERGFTLLELLVVVFILALTSSIMVPMLLRVGDGAVVSEADKLANTLSELSERSLFLGQLTALQLDDNQYRPVYYDVEQGAFIVFDQNNLKPHALPEDTRITWETEASNNSEIINSGLQRPDEADDSQQTPEDMLPAIYFLPSGDATAGILTIELDDQQQRLHLSAFGKVKRLDADETAELNGLPDLILPDDGGFGQSTGVTR